MAEAGLGRGHRGPGAWELPLQAPPTPSRYGNPVFCLLGLVFRTRLTGKSKTASCLQGPDSGGTRGGGVGPGLSSGDQEWDSRRHDLVLLFIQTPSLSKHILFWLNKGI